jgi:acyl carrier protein
VSEQHGVGIAEPLRAAAMIVEPDAFTTVRDAVAVVCQVEPASLTPATRFDDLGADSLSRVSIADVVEASFADSGRQLHLDDALLGRMTTLAELAESVAR